MFIYFRRLLIILWAYKDTWAHIKTIFEEILITVENMPKMIQKLRSMCIVEDLVY